MPSVECKRTVFKGRCLQFPPRRQQAEKENTIVLSCSKVADTTTEEDFRKESLPEAVVLHEGDIEKRADSTLKETVRNHHVIIRILPFVSTTKLNRDANLAKSAYSGTLRLTVSQTKSRKIMVVKVLLGRRHNPWDHSVACISQRAHYATQKFGKEMVHPKVLFSILNHMNVALMLQNSRTDLRKKPCMRRQRCVGNVGRYPQAQWKGQATFDSPSEVWSCTTAIFDETRGKNSSELKIWIQQNWKLFDYPETYNGYHSPWWSANKWGRNSVRQRPWFIRDRKKFRGYSCSPIAWKTLRRSRICQWVGHWSKTTSYQKWQTIRCNTEKLCRSLPQDCQQLPPSRVQVHIWWLFIKSSNNKTSKYQHCGTGRPGDNFEDTEVTVVEGFHRKSRRWRIVGIKGHTRKHFSRFRFGTCCKTKYVVRTVKPVAWSARLGKIIYGESSGWKCSSS